MISEILVYLLSLSLIYVFWYYITLYRKWENMPGPLPLPLIGNLPQLFIHGPQTPASIALSKLSKVHGEIYRLRLGSKDLVILSSINAISQVFSKDEVIGRDLSGRTVIRGDGKYNGIIISEGPIWEKTRKWTFKNLGKLGLRKGHSSFNENISEQLGKLIGSWEKEFGNSDSATVEINSHTFLLPVVQIVFKFISGVYGNRLFEKILKDKTGVAKPFSSLIFGIEHAFPQLIKILPMWASKLKRYAKMKEVAKDIFQHCKQTDEETLTRLFAKEIEFDDMFTEAGYVTLFIDLFQASSDTTSSYIRSLFWYSALYPNLQNKIHDEILKVIDGEQTSFDHRAKMPFTEAFMLETHRTVKIIPNLLPHKVTQDTDYGTFTLPKGTIVIADLYAANNDTKIWKNPHLFDPERFLCKDENGIVNISIEKRRQNIPFSVGKRSCPGESIAESTAFMFFINILKLYRVSLDPQKSVAIDHLERVDIGSTTTAPKPFKMLLKKR